ncbi:MAG: CRTAC1 family protein [Pseudotabrizicola sp.]|uniref:CRTAC1 family protein n=1 Tax=Pseudotabrizicola sp. TaxID=2939647 RepID=UPI002722AABD|nr:CRTAC1 family protein [Pseudotabrizicola sp.]MDO9637137.1 CRTAC1 family protein [Pseudotabrizicola sp.]
MRGWVFCLVLAGPAAAQDVPQFVEETGPSGLAHQFSGEWEYMVGGGVAAFDCNGDALPDLALSGGTAPAALFVNQSVAGGALAFAPVESGIEMAAVTGTYPIDIDSDGITDLMLLRVGENVVMRGLGDCRFERANEAWGFDGGDAWSTAFAAMWETGASLPTLAIGNYINQREEAYPWGSCTDNWLHRPEGTGYAAPLALTPSFCALSMLFTDWNGSGKKSLRVSNDREYYEGGQEQMWHLEASQPPRLYTEAEGWKRLRIWGMGIASTDLDADGYPEFYLTSMADNKLQRLVTPAPDAEPDYTDIAWARGVTAHRPFMGEDLRPSTGWHAQFADVNNDGRADLFVAKGNVWEMPDFAMADPNNLLLQGEDGVFVEAADKAGVASTLAARGGAVVDLNGDGALDLVVVNRNAPSQVWRNAGPVGNWARIDLRQSGPNATGIGSWVEVRTGDHLQRQEITSGGGHVSGIWGSQHFGLGEAESAEVRVIWPDGRVTEWQEVRANTVVTVSPED